MDKNLDDLMESIELCNSKGLLLPTAALTYVLMDSLATMKYGHLEKSSKKRFLSWSNNYIPDFFDNYCSPEDLYGARCAILHTMTAASSLTEAGVAKRVIYLSGNESPDILEKSQTLWSKAGFTCIYQTTLIAQLKKGMAKLAGELKSDSILRESYSNSNKNRYVNVPNHLYESVVTLLSKPDE